MFGRHFLIKAAVALLVIALVVGGISSAQRDAWMEGYTMGRLTASGAEASSAPLLPYGYSGMPGYYGPRSGGFGLFLGFGVLVLLLMVAGSAFRRRSWGMNGGGAETGPTDWQRSAQEHWERHWRQGPPWWRQGPGGEHETPSPRQGPAEPGETGSV